jgi:hypothetical protein
MHLSNCILIVVSDDEVNPMVVNLQPDRRSLGEDNVKIEKCEERRSRRKIGQNLKRVMIG